MPSSRSPPPALARQLHQTARSWARVSIRRRRRFRARVELRGFTPPVGRELQLPGLLRRCVCETRGRTPSSPFGPSPPSRAATTTSADFSLRASRRVALSGVRRDAQVRTLTFAARPSPLRRLASVVRASRCSARSPCSAAPHRRFLFIDPRFRSPLPSRRPRGSTLCGSLRSLRPAFERTCTSESAPMLGAPRGRVCGQTLGRETIRA
jgi:hypothetical protein